MDIKDIQGHAGSQEYPNGTLGIVTYYYISMAILPYLEIPKPEACSACSEIKIDIRGEQDKLCLVK
jgi:hypothetical protein